MDRLNNNESGSLENITDNENRNQFSDESTTLNDTDLKYDIK